MGSKGPEDFDKNKLVEIERATRVIMGSKGPEDFDTPLFPNFALDRT